MHKVTRALLSIVLTSPPITTQAKVLKTIKIQIKKKYLLQSKNEEFETITELSERQLAEFTMLGKFKLGQIR